MIDSISPWITSLRARFDKAVERVIYIQSTILLTVLYWLSVLYMLAVKHTIPQNVGWQPWHTHADSLDELKKEW
jgi:hypothetical protein